MQLGIAQISTWEQAALADPSNPHQREHLQYAQVPGGYGVWYYNRVPTTSQLNGSLGGVWDTLPVWGQAFVVGLIGLAGGYFGSKAYKSIRSK